VLNVYRRHQPPCRFTTRRHRNCGCPINRERQTADGRCELVALSGFIVSTREDRRRPFTPVPRHVCCRTAIGGCAPWIPCRLSLGIPRSRLLSGTTSRGSDRCNGSLKMKWNARGL